MDYLRLLLQRCKTGVKLNRKNFQFRTKEIGHGEEKEALKLGKKKTETIFKISNPAVVKGAQRREGTV